MLRWRLARDLAYLTLGAVVLALAMVLFLIPARLAAGGVSGLSLVIHHYTGWPIGAMVFAFNVPLFLLGWRYLGGPRFAWRTVYVTAVFSAVIDLLPLVWPLPTLTDDPVLQVLYGGVVSGIGAGLIYRGKGTSGGTDILARILAHRWGIPMAQSYLTSDALVLLAAGATFGWEKALYALVVLYVAGLTAEGIHQGANIARTALIITERPQEVARAILERLDRGATIFPATGAYTGQPRPVVYCVLPRSDVARLKLLVREIDPRAFMVVGQAHEVLGEGFRPWTEVE